MTTTETFPILHHSTKKMVNAFSANTTALLNCQVLIQLHDLLGILYPATPEAALRCYSALVPVQSDRGCLVEALFCSAQAYVNPVCEWRFAIEPFAEVMLGAHLPTDADETV